MYVGEDKVQPEDLVTFFRSHAPSLSNEHHEVRGSALGNLANEQFGASYKVMILENGGSLGNFIRSFCNSFLTWSQKDGGDDIYRLSTEEGTAQAEAPIDFWQRFQNPRHAGPTYINITTGEVFEIQPASAPDTEFATLNPVEVDDYRSMIRTFVETDPDIASDDIEPFIDSDAMWTSWTRLLNTSSPEKMKAWIEFRWRHLDNLLETRLLSLGLPPEIRRRVKIRISKSRTKPTTNRSESVVPVIPVPHPKTAPLSTSPIWNARSLAVAAIEQMSESDIRSIQVPIGAILDALLLRTPGTKTHE